MYKCHCCKKSSCNCASTNENGQYNYSMCNINKKNEYLCKKNEVCICENPPPFLQYQINKDAIKINNKLKMNINH